MLWLFHTITIVENFQQLLSANRRVGGGTEHHDFIKQNSKGPSGRTQQIIIKFIIRGERKEVKKVWNLHITLRGVHLMRHRFYREPLYRQLSVSNLPVNAVLVNVSAQAVDENEKVKTTKKNIWIKYWTLQALLNPSNTLSSVLQILTQSQLFSLFCQIQREYYAPLSPCAQFFSERENPSRRWLVLRTRWDCCWWETLEDFLVLKFQR